MSGRRVSKRWVKNEAVPRINGYPKNGCFVIHPPLVWLQFMSTVCGMWETHVHYCRQAAFIILSPGYIAKQWRPNDRGLGTVRTRCIFFQPATGNIPPWAEMEACFLAAKLDHIAKVWDLSGDGVSWHQEDSIFVSRSILQGCTFDPSCILVCILSCTVIALGFLSHVYEIDFMLPKYTTDRV